MIPYARLGDAIDHGGNIVSASPIVFSENLSLPIARLGDAVICFIHGGHAIASASNFVFETWIPLAREGDAITCGAVIVAPCSPVVFEQP
jgi:uncharacterized Zn-binding protein involved in type VI secretion